ncbi:hypothetical protein [Algoriphagus boritolerans]|uniref:hypothetical protein n=1 Tax=Algoriphagus boritolerans TaxID=308111 RepID=UPI000AAD38F1
MHETIGPIIDNVPLQIPLEFAGKQKKEVDAIAKEKTIRDFFKFFSSVFNLALKVLIKNI